MTAPYAMTRSPLARLLTRRSIAGLLLALVIISSLPLGGCAVNPATGQRQLLILSREEEIALGEQNDEPLAQEFGGPVQDESLQRYLRDIGEEMAAVTEGENPSLPWEFTLLDSDIINAFALPGGKIFITRGLAQRYDNEAQLASVVGHEIGHVTARHINDAMVRQMGVQAVAAAAGIAVSAATDDEGAGAAGGLIVAGAQQGASLVSLKFNRDQEIEADKLGMRYMSRIGYNPVGARQAMQVLADLGSRAAGPMEWLSTHPDPARRVDIIDERLRREYPQALENPEQDLFAARYRDAFLDPLNRLHPLDDGGSADGGQRRGATAVAWCSVCAAGAQHGTP